MGPLAKKYKKKYAYELARIAKGDLDSAKALSAAKIGRPENIVYHSQQCTEKLLKAVLCFYEKPIPHTHDLEALVAVLPEKVVPPDAFLLGTLSQYATIRKYEEGSEELSHEDFQNCILLASRVLLWAEKILGPEKP
ncbi:MAG: HEPN domain-containing protein [Deltaproteobacteria bacterium]|nr:HEPN domain-containing protein [Deltaproteobacteria bacterium]